MSKNEAYIKADGFDVTSDNIIKFFIHNKKASLYDFVSFAPLENIMLITDTEYDSAAYEKQHKDILAEFKDVWTEK